MAPARALADLAQRVYDQGGRMVYVQDHTRPSYYEGLEYAMSERELEIGHFADVTKAVASLKDPT